MFYLDTSFVALSLLDQEGADQAHRILEDASNRSKVASSVLLRIELVRMARRTRTALSRVYEILDEIHLIGISREVVEGALTPSTWPPRCFLTTRATRSPCSPMTPGSLTPPAGAA